MTPRAPRPARASADMILLLAACRPALRARAVRPRAERVAIDASLALRCRRKVRPSRPGFPARPRVAGYPGAPPVCEPEPANSGGLGRPAETSGRKGGACQGLWPAEAAGTCRAAI